MNIIIDYNRTIFDPITDTLYPGVRDVLKKVSQRNTLFLVSRNEPSRKKKLQSLEIQQYFKGVFFVNEKSKKLFSALGGSADYVFVVGDSIQDEIRIGNILGYVTIRIKQGKFANTVTVRDEEKPNYEILNITELESIISKYEK